jgi:hypothetical protein
MSARAPWSRTFMGITLLALALFATGVGPRPAGEV